MFNFIKSLFSAAPVEPVKKVETPTAVKKEPAKKVETPAIKKKPAKKKVATKAPNKKINTSGMTKKELLAYGKRIGATIKMKNTKAEMIAIIKAAEK